MATTVKKPSWIREVMTAARTQPAEDMMPANEFAKPDLNTLGANLARARADLVRATAEAHKADMEAIAAKEAYDAAEHELLVAVNDLRGG
jgi:hypothetical protein